MFAKNFSKNSNLQHLGISLPVFPSRTNLKQYHISMIPKMIKMVITKLDLLAWFWTYSSGSPKELWAWSFIDISWTFKYVCVKESCFPDCWWVSWVVPVFRNVGERSAAKNYCPVSLLSVLSEVFEKLVNNRIVDHIGKCDLFVILRMVLDLLDELQIF